MQKKFVLIIALCAHTFLLPMFTSSFKNARSLAPLMSSYQRTTMPPVARAYSKEMSALAEQVTLHKKLQHDHQEAQCKLEEALKVEDAFKSVKFFMGFCAISKIIGDVTRGDPTNLLIDFSVWGSLIGILHCTQPSSEYIKGLEKSCCQKKAELSCKESDVIAPLVGLIEQEACDGRGNPELYDSMQIIRTTMGLGTSESNLVKKGKND